MLEIIKIYNDWKDVKNVSRTTVNKQHTENEATSNFKKNILISEHSPIREIRVRWKWSNIKSWIKTSPFHVFPPAVLGARSHPLWTTSPEEASRVSVICCPPHVSTTLPPADGEPSASNTTVFHTPNAAEVMSTPSNRGSPEIPIW